MVCQAWDEAEVWQCDDNGEIVENAVELAAYAATLANWGYEAVTDEDPSVLRVRYKA